MGRHRVRPSETGEGIWSLPRKPGTILGFAGVNMLRRGVGVVPRRRESLGREPERRGWDERMKTNTPDLHVTLPLDQAARRYEKLRRAAANSPRRRPPPTARAGRSSPVNTGPNAHGSERAPGLCLCALVFRATREES